MLLRLEHVNITVTDTDAARRFLKLAFPEFETRGTGTGKHDTYSKRWEHFGTHERYLALEEIEPSRSTDRKPYQNPGVNHVGFVVDDLRALRERLTGAGYRPSRGSDTSCRRSCPSSSRMSSFTRSVRRDMEVTSMDLPGSGPAYSLVRALAVIELKGIAFLQVVKALERYAALVAVLHFADVFLKALQAGAARVGDFLTLTQHVHEAVAL